MTTDDLKELNVGDLIRHKTAQHAYVVTGNYGSHITAVRSIDVTNPTEWDLLTKAKHFNPNDFLIDKS